MLRRSRVRPSRILTLSSSGQISALSGFSTMLVLCYRLFQGRTDFVADIVFETDGTALDHPGIATQIR
jgi:hypothetical protein